jgi:hypothetical protein
MKDRVDKSMGIVTLIEETSVKLNLQNPSDCPNVQVGRNENAQIPQIKLLSTTFSTSFDHV